MARGKAAERPAPVEHDEPELENEPEQAEPLPDDIAVMELIQSLGDSDAMVNIYRQGKTARDLTLIDEIPISSFTPIMLAYTPYDGGTFRLHARSKGGFVFNRVLTVQRKSPLDVPRTPVETLTAAGVADIVRAVMRESAPPPVPPVDPFANMEKLANIMKAIQPPAPVAAPAVDTSIGARVGELTQLITLAKALSPGGKSSDDGDNGLMGKGLDLVGDLLSQARDAREARQSAQPAPAPAPAALPAPVVENNPIAVDDSEESAEMKILAKYALRKACKAAAAGDNAEEFAEEHYEDVPGDVLVEMAENPAWLDKLCDLVPDCRQHEGWLSQVREHFMRFMKEDAEAEVTAGAASPKVDNPPTAGDTPGDGNPPAAAGLTSTA